MAPRSGLLLRRHYQPRVEVLESRVLLALFAVTHTLDNGAGSLRQAITDSNGNPGLDLIVFNIPGAGAHTIQPPTLLPAITDPVIVDGFSQPGASPGNLKIELNGGGGATFGLVIEAGSSVVRGLVINGFVEDAIRLYLGGGNRLEGNYIGTNVAGTSAISNQCGVVIESGENVIGGKTTAARNVISGNSWCGIGIGGIGGNVVQGNYIGTDATGTVALNNPGTGIWIVNGSPNNLVGGPENGAGNVISGNADYGVMVSSGSGNAVQGNYIGTDVSGTMKIPNGTGVAVRTETTVVGGTTQGAGNLISGNSQYGVDLGGGSLLQGNLIGTNAAGTASLGNSTGIVMDGPSTVASNVVSGNEIEGIRMIGSATGSVIRGNLIGTGTDSALPLGNGGDGVYIAGPSNNIVGGTTLSDPNVIAFNGQYGVRVETGTGNAIRQNAIHSNGAVGIELANGGNENQSAPSVQTASNGSGSTTILVRLFSDPMTTFNIDLFSSAVCDPSNFGEGETFLGSATLTTGSTGRGRRFVVIDTEVPVGHMITATATDPNNNSSEFSKCQVVTSSPFPDGGGMETGSKLATTLAVPSGQIAFDAWKLSNGAPASRGSPLIQVPSANAQLFEADTSLDGQTHSPTKSRKCSTDDGTSGKVLPGVTELDASGLLGQ